MAGIQFIMKTLLLLTYCLHLASSVTHSMQYFYTAVKGINFPEFTVVSQMDGQQFTYYDSNLGREIPKTEWIKKNDAGDPGYWDRNTENYKVTQEVFKGNIDIAMQRFNQTGGIHTVQYMYGCEIHDDGTTGGYRQHGYDGEDFLVYNLETLSWTAPSPKAFITKNKWESNAAQMKYYEDYLKKECIDWLKKYVSYGKETLERKETPKAELFQEHASSPELVCHATGFFPKGVMMTWQKDGEEVEEDVEVRETLPNQDGSFQKRIILRVSPENLQKNKYTCVIQHGSLEKDLSVKEIRIMRDDGAPIGIIIGVVVGLLVVVLVVGGVVVWKKKNSGYKQASTGSGSEGGDSASDKS